MSLTFSLDKNKHPVKCGLLGTAVMFDGDQSRRMTKKTDFKRDDLNYHISTVFLCVDHAYPGSKKPVLWETMLFSSESPLHNYLLRATSHKQAIRLHNRTVNAVRNGHEKTVLGWE